MEQLKLFLEKANQDKELMEKLDVLNSKNAGTDEIVALASEYGFAFTEQDVEHFKKQRELSEEELEGAAGGFILPGTKTGNCFFMPSGQKKHENGALWMQCKSDCYNYLQCNCHHEPNICVNKWHKINEDTLFLKPLNYANHRNKEPDKGYST